jgi:hypothetical protein
MKQGALAVIGIIVAISGCAAQKTRNTSVKNTVYILESVRDIPTDRVFSFRDYCIFNAERGAEDSALDKTLAEADARLELHFFVETAELKLESLNGDTGAAFLAYQTRYASRFFFSENENAVELTLNTETLDEETRSSLEATPASEREAILKSVFAKSKDLLIEPDEEDNVTNYWRRVQ